MPCSCDQFVLLWANLVIVVVNPDVVVEKKPTPSKAGTPSPSKARSLLLEQALSVAPADGARAHDFDELLKRPSALMKRPGMLKRPGAVAFAKTREAEWGKVRAHFGKNRSYIQYRDMDLGKWVAMFCLSSTKFPDHEAYCKGFFLEITEYDFAAAMEKAMTSLWIRRADHVKMFN